MEKKKTTKRDIENTLWKACDSFRGRIDSSRYKDYILSMLFVKYLSDYYEEKISDYRRKYNGDERRVERAMKRERYSLDEKSTFRYLYKNRNDTSIGVMINKALFDIENANSAKLHEVFRSIDFNSTVDFGDVKTKNATLKNLLEDFNGLDLSPSILESKDIIGDAYEYMIANFASDAGKKGGEFYTPSAVSELVARLVSPKENDRIYDGTCGSGGLLLKAYVQVPDGKARIYGQELNMQTWALCRMNMFLHNIDDAVIWHGDTISNPQNIEDDKLMKFQCIVANPPFSLDKWDSGFFADSDIEEKKQKMTAELDPYKRFEWGIPPRGKGDYAFVMHFLHSLDDVNGRMGIVLPHGVLFRGAGEGKIRKAIVKDFNFLDAVIGLPANLFYGAGIPACILVFRKDRKNNDKVLFVDASGDGHYEKGKNQNILRTSDVQKIIDTYTEYKTNPNFTGEDKFSHVATLKEIEENEYNLNIPRYVDTFEEEPLIDIDEVKSNIAAIQKELAEVQEQMDKYMEELGL